MTRKTTRHPRGKPHPLVTSLREIRIARGISQLKVASMLDCDRQMISQIENGWTRHPTITFLTQYAEVLGVEITISPRDDS